MFTTNTKILRRSIWELEQGRRAMMAAPPDMFDWRYPEIPECGTPGCCWAYTKPFTSTKHGLVTIEWDAWIRRFGLPYYWARLLFRMIPEWVSDSLLNKTIMSAHTRKSAADRIMDWRCKTEHKDRDAANHIMQLLISRLRHRLAVCEVEQGEWGQKKAADFPVGQERERLVAEMEREVVCV